MGLRWFLMIRSRKWETRLRAITSIDHDATADEMRRFLSDSVSNVRTAALYRWGQNHAYADLRLRMLTCLREDRSPDVRAAAASAIMRASADSQHEITQEALAAVHYAIAHDPAPVVTIGATVALAEFWIREHMLRASPEDKKVPFEEYLQRALAPAGLTLDRILTAARTGATYGVKDIREAALCVLQPLATQVDLPVLRAAANDRDPRIRTLALDAIRYLEQGSREQPG